MKAIISKIVYPDKLAEEVLTNIIDGKMAINPVGDTFFPGISVKSKIEFLEEFDKSLSNLIKAKVENLKDNKEDEN